MDENSKVIGVAWKHRTPPYPAMAEYNAFVADGKSILKIVMKSGQDQMQAPLLMIPNCSFWDDHFYVFPEALRAGDIERWEYPEVVTLRLSIQGEGYFWIWKEKRAE